jgi:ribosomal protein S19
LLQRKPLQDHTLEKKLFTINRCKSEVIRSREVSTVCVPNFIAVQVSVTWEKVTDFDETNIAKDKA